MIISRQRKKVVLHIRDPARVTTLIPTARIIEFKGKVQTALPAQIP